MVEEFGTGNQSVERAQSITDSPPPVDFRNQTLLDTFGPKALDNTAKQSPARPDILDFSTGQDNLAKALRAKPEDKADAPMKGFGNHGVLDFSPGQKSLAAAFGDMLASAGYPKLFKGEQDPQDRDARREDRQKRREERREKIKELLSPLKEVMFSGDISKLDINSLVDKLKLAPEMLEKAKVVTQALQGVESVKFSKTDDGKLGVAITRKEENQIDINKEQPGPPKVTVKNATIGKDLSFKIGKDGDNFKLEDIQGIKVNSTVELPKLLGGNKDVSVELKSATLDKDKDGKSVIKAEVTNPLVPGKTMPVVVPLSPETKK